jgi:hypothetical protein
MYATLSDWCMRQLLEALEEEANREREAEEALRCKKKKCSFSFLNALLN